jgi:hypothetical protein
MTPGAFDYLTSYKNKYFPLDLKDVLIVEPTSFTVDADFFDFYSFSELSNDSSGINYPNP